MKQNKFSNIIILFVLITSLALVFTKTNIFNSRSLLQTNLSQGLRAIKVTEEKFTIDDKEIHINVRMPEIHYQNAEVERYINSYIRKDINQYINNQRQLAETEVKGYKPIVNISYSIAFEDRNLLNIVVNRNTKMNKNKIKYEKDSYVFDLKTGQRIYLDNFLKNNSDYQDVIKTYIAKEYKHNINKSKININKYTEYYITDGGISIYFNPYKESKESTLNEFKIPHSIFKKKISVAQTDEIEANIDTQTITENNKYINSVVNIPIIITSNKEIEKSVNDKLRNDIMDFYNGVYEEAKKYLDNNTTNENKFVVNVGFDIKKNSNNILSIKVRYYRYSGGFHGEYEDITYNIDMRNGNFLVLDDLFKKGAEYKKVIDEEIRRQIEDLVKADKENEGIYQFNDIKYNQKFYIQDDNLVIYFDLYEIAPYAAGIPEFPIKSDKINHILKDEYIDIFQ